nr:MAG TPA: hypothetical protein [Caudoviricetes sp.]
MSLLYSIKKHPIGCFFCFVSRYTFKNKSCLARYCLSYS